MKTYDSANTNHKGFLKGKVKYKGKKKNEYIQEYMLISLLFFVLITVILYVNISQPYLVLIIKQTKIYALAHLLT